jgi:hypothetical protein
MRKLPYVFAAAALASLTLSAGPGSASPLTGSLATGAAVPEFNEGLVQKVHGWHCRKRYGWYRGHKWWHRHRRACDDYDDDHYGGYYPGPSIGFGFYGFDDDDHHGGYKYKKKYYKKGGNKDYDD